jgi:hypothetical protein
MNESEYLAAVARHARAGMAESSRALGEELLAAVELQRIVRRHPWWSVGVSAGGGWAFGRYLAAHARHSGQRLWPILILGTARRLFSAASGPQATGHPDDVGGAAEGAEDVTLD